MRTVLSFFTSHVAAAFAASLALAPLGCADIESTIGKTAHDVESAPGDAFKNGKQDVANEHSVSPAPPEMASFTISVHFEGKLGGDKVLIGGYDFEGRLEADVRDAFTKAGYKVSAAPADTMAQLSGFQRQGVMELTIQLRGRNGETIAQATSYQHATSVGAANAAVDLLSADPTLLAFAKAPKAAPGALAATTPPPASPAAPAAADR